jgi:hypothetical protein
MIAIPLVLAVLYGAPTQEVENRIEGQGASVAFTQDRVFGPHVSLARRADGSWAGNVRDEHVDLKWSGSSLNGAGVAITVEKVKGDTVAQGLWRGERVRISASRLRKYVATTPPNYPNKLRFLGEAQQLDLSRPEFLLALISMGGTHLVP